MPDLWELLAILFRFLLYLGVLGSTGSVMVRLAFPRETGSIDRTIGCDASALALLALLAAGLGFLLGGARMAGGIAGAADAEMLGLLWRSPAGTQLVLLVSGAVLMLCGLRVAAAGRRIGLWIALAGGVLALWSFARAGHVPDAGPSGLQAVLVVHLAAAAFWIGVLAPLRRLAGGSESLTDAAQLGRRFGRIAAFTVPVLIVAGGFMVFRLLGGPPDPATGYGLTLIAKFAGVAVLLGAAAANKLRFVPALGRGDRRAAARLRGSIAVEWLAVCVILLATAILTTLQHVPQ